MRKHRPTKRVKAAGREARTAGVGVPPGFVLLRAREYEQLVLHKLAREAVDVLKKADDTEWVDADEAISDLRQSRITAARKRRGLSQQELGKRLGMPQSQISRLERNPDGTTIKTLRRLAKVLNVDVRELV